MEKKCTIVACSIFKDELEKLRKNGELDNDIIYIDSMLHMYPQKLEKLLNAELEKQNNKKLIILYGDCHGRILQNQNENIKKVPGLNCCDIFLGKEQYRRLRKQGAFILFSEWLTRWKEIFQVELGLTDKAIAQKFMKEMHKEIVYIDTMVNPVPYDILEEIKDFTGLNYRVEPCDTVNLKAGIEEIQKSFDDGK